MMERLTYNEVLAKQYYPNENIDNEEIFNKLGKLEDIEQELEIPLEVLFKALKEGVYRLYEEFEGEPPYVQFSFVSIVYDEDNSAWVFECSNLDIYDLKDYGKTWALTREELEND